MCWGIEVTAGMVVVGAAGAVVTARRGDPVAIPLTLAYFALMEALQFWGYLVIDQCGTPANRAVTALSMLHIIVQPLVINAFAMALVSPSLPARTSGIVFGLSGVASLVMLVQMLPLPQMGSCLPGTALCGTALCTVSGGWHLAWDVPYNGLLVPLEHSLGTAFGFPTYILAVFVLPLFYGALRFTLLHLVTGPLLAFQLTGNPNEAPAVWCLFSVAILILGLSPAVRQRFGVMRAAA